jgi:hypothetical protein
MGKAKCNLNFSKINNKADRLSTGILKDLSNAVKEDADEFVPFLTGALRNSFKIDFETVSNKNVALIIWDTPYAKRQYYEVNNKTVGTDHWIVYMKDENLRRWLDEIGAKRKVYIIGR